MPKRSHKSSVSEAKKKIPQKSKKSLKSGKVPHKKVQQQSKWRVYFFLILFIFGINILALSSLFYLYRQMILSFKAVPVTQVELAHRRGLPLQVEIEEQNIALPITEASISNGIWETSDTGATHLETSARPGEGGNVVIYGHNRKHLFGPLRQTIVGDTITITTEEGKKYEYTVQETTTVKPEEISVVLPTDHEVLTLYTCTGFLDSLRFVIKAYPTGVSSL